MHINDWKVTIGLEVHIQLLTESKLFSHASTAYGAAPNTQVSYIDLGLPGTLPVLNQEAIRMGVLFGLSIHADLPPETIFARKHYFYPDLPKGYQISQHDHPVVGSGGYLTIPTEQQEKVIRITRAHLEEDAGKSVHDEVYAGDHLAVTGIDLNRAGVPLLEIVTEPDLDSAKEAVTFLKKLHRLVCYLKICDGNMQEGSFRCDANVSVRPKDQKELGVRAELKNLNSFRYVEEAINIEARRQIKAITAGEILTPETRSFDPTKQITTALRAKEAETEYRYMPDPDLYPVPLTKDFVAKIANQMPELPDAKHARFKQQYHLTDYDTEILVATQEQADYFESVVREGVDVKLAVNWINGELAAALNDNKLKIDESPVSPKQLANLLKRVADDTLSRTSAKTVFEHLWQQSEAVDLIIQRLNLSQVSDEKVIQAIIDEVLAANQKQLLGYRQGKVKLFGFFVGQVMQRTQGRCHPGKLNALLKRTLDAH